MKFKYLPAALLGLLLTVSCLSNIARASLINIEVIGSADSIDPALAQYFDIGDEMTLRFNMDVVGVESGWFSSSNQLSPLAFSIGTYNGSVSSYRPSITNGAGCTYTCGDVWAAEAKNDFGTTFNFPMFGNYYLDIVQIEYRDNSGTALNTVNMATSIEQLSNFTRWHIGLYFKDINNPNNVRASILSNDPTFTVSPVPEPSTLPFSD
ncbi:MAG: hypothetical protein ACJA13_003189 [Paraglaciecola sp.]|jgi:hypothetical protein